MSKAFTKENDDKDNDDLEPTLQVPSGKNYISASGLKKLKDELNHILDVDRPEIVRIVSWAASNGDRSENGDYLYGKKKLRELDRRIRFLSKRIEIAEVVYAPEKPTTKVLFGATLVVENESGVKKTLTIVGIDETDVNRGRISWISPIGKALLQADQGDVVTVKTPKGDEDFEILEVSYPPID